MGKTGPSMLNIIITLLALSLIALLIFYKRTQNSSIDASAIVKKDSGNKNHFFWLYKLFKKTPFLKKYFIRIRKKVSIIYPADEFTINKKTTSILGWGTLAGLSGVLASVLISGGNILFLCSGLLITYILISSTVNNQLIVLNNKLLRQFTNSLNKIRHYYHESGIVESSLFRTLETAPFLIGLHLQTFHDIIGSPNMRNELDQYVGSEPNKYMLMLLSICSSIKEFGDKILENGSSLFLIDLNYLKEEVNAEMIANMKRKAAFSGATILAIAPVVCLKPIEMWATSEMPEMAQYYSGIYGIVAMVIIFVSSFICHSLVVSLRDGAQPIEKDTDIWAKLSGKSPLSKLLNKVIYKNYTKYARYNDKLKGIGNHTGPKALLLKRIVFAIIAFIMTGFILFFGGLQQKKDYIVNWANEYQNTVVPNEEYRNELKSLSKDYAKYYKSKIPDKKTLEESIRSQTDMDGSLITEMTNTIIGRLEKAKKTYFKWYYLLIACTLGWISFMAPVWNLKFKTNLIETRKNEEVIQFQSLMLILMHINGTTVSVILEWMERFSYCFKESITMCCTELNSGQIHALQTMKDRESTHQPFCDFVDNLITIDKVGVEKAFDEIQTDRDYYKQKHEQDLDTDIHEKGLKANFIALIPFIEVLGLYLILPMIMYAFSMLKDMTTVINGG